MYDLCTRSVACAVPTIGGAHGAQTRAHSASKTRVNALAAHPTG